MEFIDKLLKFITIDDRIIIGKVKSVDYLGNIYLSHSVEVFNKEEGYISNLEIFDNTSDQTFHFESEKNQYQLMGNTVIKQKSIKEVIME